MSARLISQLAHVEVVSPQPEASVDFFTNMLGMSETQRVGQSVYMRTWADWFHHSLVITEGPAAALAHVGWRADGPDELEIAAGRLADAGCGERWADGLVGQGPTYLFRAPGGQLNEIFWEVDRFQPAPEERSSYPNRPARFVQRGAAVRQLDHATCASSTPLPDAEWYRDMLGFRLNEITKIGDRTLIAMVSNNEKSHELGLIADSSGVPGRAHHIAYWVDDPVALLNAADGLLEHGSHIEWGPSRHGIGEQYSVYFREPGGMRVEITTGGYRIYQPDWEPIVWSPDQGSREFYRPSYETDLMVEMFPSANS
jgi:catechol 2,3-dioxygenase